MHSTSVQIIAQGHSCITSAGVTCVAPSMKISPSVDSRISSLAGAGATFPEELGTGDLMCAEAMLAHMSVSALTGITNDEVGRQGTTKALCRMIGALISKRRGSCGSEGK